MPRINIKTGGAKLGKGLRYVRTKLKESQQRSRDIRRNNPNIFSAAKNYSSSQSGRKVKDIINRFNK